MSLESLFEQILMTEQQVSENIKQLHEGNAGYMGRLTVNLLRWARECFWRNKIQHNNILKLFYIEY